jgi:hypothetical protein
MSTTDHTSPFTSENQQPQQFFRTQSYFQKMKMMTHSIMLTLSVAGKKVQTIGVLQLLM